MTHSDTAHQLVLGDRNASYGNPHEDFAGTALMWSGLLNAKLKAHITASDVALMMVALKLRRHAHKPKDDNIIDGHGYLTCLEWIEKGHRPTPAIQDEREACQRAIEDICTGGRLECPKCGQFQPCLCQHEPPPQST